MTSTLMRQFDLTPTSSTHQINMEVRNLNINYSRPLANNSSTLAYAVATVN